MTKISVIGLGYVGLVSAVCFSRMGHKVIGVDINEDKVAAIKLKKNPLERVENLGYHIKNVSFEVLLDKHKEAIMNSSITFVCVETPTNDNGAINLIPLKKVCRTIGKVLKEKEYHIIVIRSTMFPGSLEIVKKELEMASGKVCGKDFDIATNPEFLREVQAVYDFFNPCYIVVGADKKEVGERVMNCYLQIKSKKFVVSNEISQMIKYANNSWHGCKVVFTNELGRVCDRTGVDKDELMKLFCEDTKLNISPYYMKPGKAFGGHCLPKDLAVLRNKSKQLKANTPLLDAIFKSNEIQKAEMS